MTLRNKSKSSYKQWIIGFIIALFIILRIVGLPEVIQFGSDQGRDFLTVWNLYNTKEVTLIGPPSEYKIDGREFFFGPAPYYLILPPLLVGNWNPIVVSYFLIFLNAAILLAALVIVSQDTKNKKVVYGFGLLVSLTPAFIAYAQSYWNPHFMLPVAILLVALLVKSKFSDSLKLFFSIGLLFGLGMQFHYSFIFAIIIGFIWLIWNKKITIRTFTMIVLGGILGFLPVLLFELRNNFYNLNTLLLVLNHSSTALKEAKFNSFYLISLFPFLVYALAILLAKINKSNIFYGIIGLYAIFSLAIIFSAPKQLLPYPTLLKMAEIIKQDNPSNYNIADQLTRDNRAMALRYLLTVNGVQPQSVEAYPQAQTLYVYSKEPLNTLLKNPVWELQTFQHYKRVTIWNGRDVTIYRLEK